MNTKQKAEAWLASPCKLSVNEDISEAAEIITALLKERDILVRALTVIRVSVKAESSRKIADRAITLCEKEHDS